MKLRVSLILTMFLASIAWQRIVPTSAVFGDVPTGHLHKLAIDYVQSKGIVSGYPDGTYQPDRLLNRAEFTKIIVESRFSRLEIDNCLAAEGFYKRSLFSDVASAVWYEKYVCVGRTNDIIGGYPDGTFRGEQTINYAEAAKIIVNSYGLRVASRDPWFAPFLEKLTELNALPPSLSTTPDLVDKALRNVTRGEMAELIYRLRGINDTITSPDGSFTIKIPEKALPMGVNREAISVTKVPPEEGPVEEIHGAPMVFYKLEPDGLQFSEPVTFQVRTPTQRNTIPMVFLVSGSSFDMIPEPVIEIDQSQQQASLSGQLDHFSHLSLGMIDLFSLRTETVEQQDKKEPFIITARISRHDTQNTFSYTSAQETITILSSWVLSSGTFSSELDNVFPQIINDAPVTSLLSGPKTYTASKMFSCAGVFPSSAQVKYQTALNFTYTKSRGNQKTTNSNALFLSTTTNRFHCIDQEATTPESVEIPTTPVDPYDPNDLNCLGADYPVNNEPSVAVEVLKFSVNGSNNPRCFIEPDLQFGPPVGPDLCPESHYHGGPAFDLFAISYSDPNPSACGYGRVSEVQSGIITISEEQYDGLMTAITPLPNFQVPNNSSPTQSGSHSFLEKFIMSDTCGHDPFIGLSSTMNYTYQSNTRHLVVSGSTSSGNFSLEGDVSMDGLFILTGSATVAGISGTAIELEGSWVNSSFESTKITFGSNGTLPGGCPITYGLVFP